MDTRERPALEKLLKELEKKVQHLPAGHGDLQRHAVSAFKAGSQWLKDLQALVKQRNLHLTPDHKYAKPLELEKFKGHKDAKTNVYEFFRLYEIISRSFTTEHKAHFLYSNYLDEEVKSTVMHLREDYQLMKKSLILKYGDINRLLTNKKNTIKALPAIQIRSSDQQKATFIKKFSEVLEQIQSLVDLNKKNFPAMETEIYSHTNVMSLSALLPIFLYTKFSDRYVRRQQSIDGEQVSGKEAFQLLLKVLKDEHRSVEFKIENYHQEVPEKKEEMKRINAISNDSRQRTGSGDKGRKHEDMLYKAPCFVHAT